MGDRRIGKDALNVVLKQGEQIAGDHREDGNDAQRARDRSGLERPCGQEIAQEQRQHRTFRDNRYERCDWRRRAFVNVGRPHVKGHERQLEADGGQEHCDAGKPEQVGGAPFQGGPGGPGERQRPEIGIDERDPEQEKCRRDSGEDQIFDARFNRPIDAARICDQPKEGDAQGLQPEKETGEVAARHHRGRAQRRQEEEHVVLLTGAVIVRLEIPIGQQ